MTTTSSEKKSPANFVIRSIAPEDDAALENLVKSTLTEFGCVGPGFASSDPELKSLSGVYGFDESSLTDRGYWVVVDEHTQEALGGSGFSRLKGTTEADGICELQKVYFSPKLRGLGFGRKIVELCIREAARAGYRQMYLETMPQMSSAVGMYEKFGFRYVPGPLGNTGHSSCTVFMTLDLESPASS